MWPPMQVLAYPVTIVPLSVDDGGGYAAVVPDLPGCMSDGESPEEALANAPDPAPDSQTKPGGLFRVPRVLG